MSFAKPCDLLLENKNSYNLKFESSKNRPFATFKAVFTRIHKPRPTMSMTKSHMNKQSASIGYLKASLLQLCLLLALDSNIHVTRAAIGGEVIVADNTIGTSSTFTYELDISTRIPSTGKLSISFHPDFNLTPNEVISCTATYGFTGSAACAVDATGTFIEL